MALAIFDIDGTLVAGPSTEKRLFAHLLRTGRLGVPQLLAFVRTGLAPDPDGHAWKRNKSYLAGLACADVAAGATAWAARAAADWWFEPCVVRLREHQAAGDDVVLLSGTPQFLADELARQLGAGRAIGTLCAAEGGVFRPAPPVRHPFGAAKLELARRLCAESGVPAAAVIAYGDSRHDVPLLGFAGRAVAVRPDAGLRAEARRRGWPVIGRR